MKIVFFWINVGPGAYGIKIYSWQGDNCKSTFYSDNSSLQEWHYIFEIFFDNGEFSVLFDNCNWTHLGNPSFFFNLENLT